MSKSKVSKKLVLDGRSMTLLSGLALYGFKGPVATRQMHFLNKAREEKWITPEVFAVGKIIVDGKVPPGTSPQIEQAAKHYLGIAKSHQSDSPSVVDTNS